MIGNMRGMGPDVKPADQDATHSLRLVGVTHALEFICRNLPHM